MTIKSGTKVYDIDGKSGFEFVKDFPVGSNFTASHVISFGNADKPVTGMIVPWYLAYYIANGKAVW